MVQFLFPTLDNYNVVWADNTLIINKQLHSPKGSIVLSYLAHLLIIPSDNR